MDVPATSTASAVRAARLEGVSHRWNGDRALRGVDLELRRGTITALVGANGAGKTTLLRILAGILAPTRGRVEVLGIADPAGRRDRAAREIRRRVAYVAQAPALDPEMTGRETLTLLAACHGVGPRGRRRRVEELARAFGAQGHLDRRIAAFSGGLRRRLHLAGGMIHDPELVLLDEPTAGLDEHGRTALWDELRRRARSGRAVVVVTHDLAAVEEWADRGVILEAGRVVADDAPAGLVRRAGASSLAAAYRSLTGRAPEELAPPSARRRETGRWDREDRGDDEP